MNFIDFLSAMFEYHLFNLLLLGPLVIQGTQGEIDNLMSFDYTSGLCGIATEAEEVTNHKYYPQFVIELRDHYDVPEKLLTPHRYGFSGVMEKDLIQKRSVPESLASFPWIAQIRYGTPQYTEFACSAAIISHRFLLTSAVCIAPLSLNYMVIRVGDFQEGQQDEFEEEYSVLQVFTTENTDGLGTPRDIALLQIKLDDTGDGILFSKDVLPVCLPSADTPYLSGLGCTAAGYEDLTSEEKILNIQNVGLLPKSKCDFKGEFFTKGMICGERVHTQQSKCPINAGSPLVCKINGRSTLMGIQSLYGCGSDTSPSSYADVQSNLAWIARIMKQLLSS